MRCGVRPLWIAFVSMVALLGCSPGSNTRRCEGVADFVLTLSSPTGSFPADTKIEVTFGGGSQETYWLSAANDPEVLICETTPAGGAGEGGAAAQESNAGAGGNAGTIGPTHGGASSGNTKAIGAIRCEIWSGGPATISIRAATWHTTRELKPDDELCSLSEDIVLGEPDPKP